MSNDEDNPFEPRDVGVFDPATFPARSARPIGLATPELQLLCVRCWSAVEGFSERACGKCKAPRPPHGWPTLPYVFRQRYLFMRPIGRGGMGAVFLAYDEQQHHGTKTPLAVKVVPQASSTESRQQLRELFEREASAAAMLAQAPHFVRVLAHDVGVDPAYLVMEHVEWPTLRDCIREARVEGRKGGLSPVVVARIGLAVLRGVSVMHYHRIVHRDLKPSNIFFRRSENDDFDIKILDFGVWTREAAEQGSHDSVVGLGHRLDQVPVGTYSYMSPEQMAGRPVNARSDLHTLGSVLWELTTGDVPYRMNNTLQGRALADRFERLKSLPLKPEGMSDGFYEILARALAYNPEDRWDSAEEMKLALKVWVAEEVLRTRTAFSGFAGRIETLDAQVEHVKAQLAPGRDLLHRVDQLSGLVYLLKSQAEDATPEAVTSAVEEMEARMGELGHDLGVFSRNVLEGSLRLSRDKTEDLAASVDLPPLRDPAELREAAFVGPVGPRLVFLASVFSALVAAVAFTVVLSKRGSLPAPSMPSTTLAAVAPAPTAPPTPKSSAPETARVRVLPAGHGRGPVLVATEPGRGGLLTAGRDGTLMRLEPSSGQTHRLASFSSPIHALAVHPSSTLAAVGLEDGRLILIETGSGRKVFERRGDGSPISVLRFSPRGRELVFPGDADSLRVLRPDSLEERRLGAAPGRRRSSSKSASTTRDFSFSPDGRAIHVLGAKGVVRSLDLETGRSIGKAVQLEPHDATRLEIGGSDQRLIYEDGNGRLYARSLGAERGGTEVLRAGDGRSLGFTTIGSTLYLARPEGGIEVVDLDHKAGSQVLAAELGPIVEVAVGPSEGRLVLSDVSRRVHLLSVARREVERSFPAGPTGLLALTISRDGLEVAVAEAEGTEVRLLDPATWAERSRLSAGTAPVRALVHLADGRLLGGDGSGDLWLWQKDEPKGTRVGTSSGQPVTALVADAQLARVVVARGRKAIELLDVDTGRTLRRMDAGQAEVTGLALSADGVLLAASTEDGHITLFETEHGRRIHSVQASRAALRSVAFSPDGRSFASVGDQGSVFVYRTDTATLLRTHRDEGAAGLRLAFAEGGRRIVTARADGSIQVFEANGPRRVLQLEAHAGPITGLLSDSQGGLVSVSLDGTLRTHGPQGDPLWVAAGAGPDWIGLSPNQASGCIAPGCELLQVEAVD